MWAAAMVASASAPDSVSELDSVLDLAPDWVRGWAPGRAEPDQASAQGLALEGGSVVEGLEQEVSEAREWASVPAWEQAVRAMETGRELEWVSVQVAQALAAVLGSRLAAVQPIELLEPARRSGQSPRCGHWQLGWLIHGSSRPIRLDPMAGPRGAKRHSSPLTRNSLLS